MSFDLSVRPLPTLAAIALSASAAHATWSLVLIDTSTGEIALGSATCLTNFDLQASTPTLLTGIGGSTAQSFVDPSGANKTFIRDQFLFGTPPETIIDLLSEFDPGHETRQYGIADTMGGTATFTGAQAGEWAGGVTGQVGDIVYAIQGNVLTGEPVVTMAEQAVIDTPGDLAEKLMAGMEAARLMGGDGRCSCAPNDPTGCGSPPDEFEKSAHIGYMLIARAGDVDLCNPSYRAGGSPWDIDAGDVNGDGLVDLAFADNANDSVSVLINDSTFGPDLLVFQQPVEYETPSNTHEVVLHDLNRDGALDLISANFMDDSVSVRLGNGDGTFGERADFPVGDGPEAIILADVNGDGSDDVLTADVTGDTVSVLPGDGAGGFGTAIISAAADLASDLAALDLDDDGDLDLAVTARNSDTINLLLNDGNGQFTVTGILPVADAPLTIVTEDFDSDGDLDLAIGHIGLDPVVTVALQQPGFLNFDLTEVPVPEPRPARITSLDMNGDGLLDLLAATSNSSSVIVIEGLPDGQFQTDAAYDSLGINGGIAARDFDLDGDIDVALATPNPQAGYLMTGLGGLQLNGGLGCGQGDHWMQFNVPFQTVLDPDPVFQLQDMFDEWRDDLLGRPDAVQSTVDFDPDTVIGDGRSTTTMTISLLDWQQDAITVPIDSVSVEHAPGSAALATIGDPVDQGGGVYSVQLTAGDAPGTDAFTVTVDDGIRPVILMPDPAITFLIDPDINGDGSLDIFDFIAFQELFQDGDLDADANGDGSLDVFDFVAFQDAFNAR